MQKAAVSGTVFRMMTSPTRSTAAEDEGLFGANKQQVPNKPPTTTSSQGICGATPWGRDQITCWLSGNS